MKKVAISACLIGQKVRYDGLSKLHQPIMAHLSEKVELIPFCPEVGIGLSIPREKIQLCYNPLQFNKPLSDKQVAGRKIRVKEINNPDKDYTDDLSAYGRYFMQQNPNILAIILKSKSPSCGLNSTPVIVEKDYQKNDSIVASTSVTEVPVTIAPAKNSGQFAYIMSCEFQSIILVEDIHLQTRIQCEQFLFCLSKT